MKKVKHLILGGGIAGLAAGIHLKEKNEEYLILEKNDYIGGLCAGFHIDQFDFDYFIHLSFTNNEFVRGYFDVTHYNTHIPNPSNYYHGIWVKHPAINNLYPLSEKDKRMVLEGLIKREQYKAASTDNYEYWLRYQFGDYFAEHFPMTYTRKYWCVEAREMETKWVGNRIYQPTMEEVIQGMKTTETPVTYYAKEMRYPYKGGFAEYLRGFSDPDRINTGERVLHIYPQKHIVETEVETYQYDYLYSSIPLPEIKTILDDQIDGSDLFYRAVNDLHWTSGYLVSFGCTGQIPRNDLWDYIYDEDVCIARYYSPSIMSEMTAPEGCYSLQAEVYTKDGNKCEDEIGLQDEVIFHLDRIGALRRHEIIVKDIRFVKYCNIIFDHFAYDNRKKVLDFLRDNSITPIGRFGEWQYYWSDQSFMSGYNAV